MSNRIIKLRLKTENDLYNPLDPDRTVLSSEVKEYLSERFQERRRGDSVELRILSEEALDQNAVRTALKNWVDAEKQAMKISNRKSLMAQTILFIFGFLLILSSILLSGKIPAIWEAVLSTIGSFSIWEASGRWMIRRPQLNAKRIILEQLSDHTTIVFEDKNCISS